MSTPSNADLINTAFLGLQGLLSANLAALRDLTNQLQTLRGDLAAIRGAIQNMSDQVTADLDAIKGAAATISTGIDGLQAQIAQLQAQLAAGQAITPDQLAELHQDALDVQADVAKLPVAPGP